MLLSRRRVLQLALAPALLPRPQVQDLAPVAARVYPGIDNKLVYMPDRMAAVEVEFGLNNGRK